MNPVWPLEYVVLAGAAFGLFLCVAGWRSSQRAAAAIRVTCLALRATVALALLAMALNLGRWWHPPAAETPEWVFLLDTSRSMADRDGGGRTRVERAAQRILALRKALPEGTPSRLEAFSDIRQSLPPGQKPAEIAAEGASSNILGTVLGVLRGASGDPGRLAGIVVASDGIQLPSHDLADVVGTALAMNVPLYGVCVGGNVPLPDVELRPGRIGLPAFVGQPMDIPVRVRASGLGRVALEIVARDGQGSELGRTSVLLRDEGWQTHNVRCPAPDAPGYVRVAFQTRTFPGENRVLNNSAEVGVQVFETAIKVLLIEGLPHWDCKFLAQLLRARDYISLTELYRLGPDRFYQLNSNGERMDRTGPGLFPETPEQMASYDAVILGKGMDGMLAPNTTALLERFVADRGGALVFARGQPRNSSFEPLEAIEPVVWGSRRVGRYAMAPTEAGARMGLFGEKLPGADAQVWGMLPPIKSLFEIKRLKPFTSVLAETKAEGIPLVVSRRYGRGVVVAVNAEGLWQWDFFPRIEESRTVYREFWPRLVQWVMMSAEFPPGTEVVARSDRSVVEPGETVQLALVCRSEASVPPGVSPTIEVRDAAGTVQELQPGLASSEAGRWTAFTTFAQAGLYQIQPVVPGVSAVAGTGVEVLPPKSEGDELSARPDFLRRLCDRTGGALLGAGEKQWPPERAVEIDRIGGRAMWMPAWDRWWYLVVVCAALAAEWYLRRRNLLA